MTNYKSIDIIRGNLQVEGLDRQWVMNQYDFREYSQWHRIFEIRCDKMRIYNTPKKVLLLNCEIEQLEVDTDSVSIRNCSVGIFTGRILRLTMGGLCAKITRPDKTKLTVGMLICEDMSLVNYDSISKGNIGVCQWHVEQDMFETHLEALRHRRDSARSILSTRRSNQILARVVGVPPVDIMPRYSICINTGTRSCVQARYRTANFRPFRQWIFYRVRRTWCFTRVGPRFNSEPLPPNPHRIILRVMSDA